MDALYFKVEHLRSLWAEYRVANETFGKDYGDQSAWAREKLQPVLTEFDKLIQEQVLWKSSLAAEIEDLLTEIEERCQLFGRLAENVLSEVLSPLMVTNTTTRDTLQSIRDRLDEEIRETRENLAIWLDSVTLFVQELGTGDVVPPKEIFETDLSASVVQPIWYKYDSMIRVVAERRNMFEDNACQLHFYMSALNYKPIDAIDAALLQLFSDKQTPKDISELLQQIRDIETANSEADNNLSEKEKIPSRTYVYYTPNLPTGLNLSEGQLAILKEKITVFATDYTERKARRDQMHKMLQDLWNELNMPIEEQKVQLRDSLDDEYLDSLSAERERLCEIMRAIIQKAIEEYTAQLEELWDKCLVPQNERNDFLSHLRELTSAEEVYELLAQEVARLQELYAKCASIYKLMLERRALIEKMIEFEKKASDPRRLFQSSFRLLEEEKWRKTCWPNLVKIENKLIAACLEYEENERKPFMHESVRYLDTLQNEIGERIVNQMFFGFEQSASKNPKLSKENLEAAQEARKRRESESSTTSPIKTRRDSKLAPSRPVSPTFSVASSRATSPSRSSQKTTRRTSLYLDVPNEKVASAQSSPTLRTQRSSMYFGGSKEQRSRPGSPTKAPSRRTSMYLNASTDSGSKEQRSRPGSPTKAPSRRTSMYLNASTDSGSKEQRSRPGSPTKAPSRRTSMYLNASTDNSSRSRPVSPSPSSSRGPSPASRQRRSTVIGLADKSTENPKSLLNVSQDSANRRSNSISSSSSTSSNSSTPEPHIVNGRLAVSSSSHSKSKLSKSTSISDKANTPVVKKSSSLNVTSSRPQPTRNATAPALRKTSIPTPNSRPRPQSMVNGVSIAPAAMLKKRMSMVVEGGL